MTPLDAMKQALDAFNGEILGRSQYEAITNLRTAIEEMEKAEPVAWRWRREDGRTFVTTSNEALGSEWAPLYTHPAPIPEGWQLVPKVATETMWLALSESVEIEDAKEDCEQMWTTLLAAAPKPEDV